METKDFLAEIYRGAKMGTETIGTILPKVTDLILRDELIKEQNEFKNVEDTAFGEMTKRSETPKQIPIIQRAETWMGIQMSTINNAKPSHIAEMLMQGNEMGVIGITKSLNSHPQAEKIIKDMAQDLIKAQENNIKRLKPFLGKD